MQKDLEKWVIKDFVHEYLRGRTPNPCVRCNRYLKFDALLKKALSSGANFLATGHYARIEKVQSSRFKVLPPKRDPDFVGKSYCLKKAKDKIKDQSYFLYRLTQRQLKYISFPLGNYTKKEVRNLAKKFELPVADKLASQEICFLPGADYRGFLKARLTANIKPGPVVDKQGNILGQHKGIAFYTIGQREGLGIAKGYPLYITKIGYKDNKITVGEKEDALKEEFLIKEPYFIAKPIKKKVAARVRIRYNHKEALADIIPFGNQIKVCFRKPQFAITPGQSAVFYDRDIVLGGGIIDRVLR